MDFSIIFGLILIFSLFIFPDSSQSPMDNVGSEIKIDSLQTGVNFSIKGDTQVEFFIVDDQNTNIKYKLVIGAQENAATYLSEITRGMIHTRNIFCFRKTDCIFDWSVFALFF